MATNTRLVSAAVTNLLAGITRACEHYEQSAPVVHDYLDGLYRRINSATDSVRLAELLWVETLWEDGIWMHANYAANACYKLQHRLGMNTEGMIGF